MMLQPHVAAPPGREQPWGGASVRSATVPLALVGWLPPRSPPALLPTGKEQEEQEGKGETAYGDEKVANRDIRVWHGATENGP